MLISSTASRIRLLATSMFCSLAVVPTGATAQDRGLIDAVRRATVTISAMTAEGRVGGSGFLLSADGVVATAAHVLDGASSAIVRLRNGEEFEVAGVLFADESRDFALVRVPGFGLPTVRVGNSDSVFVGQRVLTFGAPLGLEATVSDGLLSSDRLSRGVRYFQLSAPVSPGSSGGPVADETGSVIGIVVSGIFERDAQNLNFALPINYLRGALSIARERDPVALAEWDWDVRPRARAEVSPPPQDRASSLPDRVNHDLGVHWANLDGVELYAEGKGDQGLRWKAKTQYRVARDAEGHRTFERFLSQVVDEAAAFMNRRDVWRDDMRTVIRIGGEHVITTYADRTVFRRDVPLASYTQAINETQFSLDSLGVTRSQHVPQGVFPIELIQAVIAAITGELPRSIHIWFVTSAGQASPVRVEFGTVPSKVTIPLSFHDAPCEDDTRTIKVSADVVTATYTIGATRVQRQVMRTTPHVAIDEELQCVRLPGVTLIPG